MAVEPLASALVAAKVVGRGKIGFYREFIHGVQFNIKEGWSEEIFCHCDPEQSKGEAIYLLMRLPRLTKINLAMTEGRLYIQVSMLGSTKRLDTIGIILEYRIFSF